jgi:hypothetical protein
VNSEELRSVRIIVGLEMKMLSIGDASVLPASYSALFPTGPFENNLLNY